MMQPINPYTGPIVPVRLSFASLYKAWMRARRGKRPSANYVAFANRWLEGLQTLHQHLRAGHWLPRRTVSFVVDHPKTREIHAPHFADRVVHHWLVPQLESLYEPVFIYDSFANRQGKGSHAAVDRLQTFMRQRNGQGWLLQLDVHNFFNSIHRPTLYGLLKHRLGKAEQRGLLGTGHIAALRSLCHKLLAQPVQEWCATPQAAARVPAHKRLRNAPPGHGLPIGNLTSQFFANVYLNELDQFIKHTLKVKHYVRYVDDFVLLADTPVQLQLWQSQIAQFLQEKLRLRLKDEQRLVPIAQGVDFLGYVVFPYYRLVRRRIVTHCKTQLATWAKQHVRITTGGEETNGIQSITIRANPRHLVALQQRLASYWGHFTHAHSMRLRRSLFARFPWLPILFDLNAQGKIAPRWVLQGETMTKQVQWLRQQWPQAQCLVQKGYETLGFAPQAPPTDLPTEGSYLSAVQTGWLRHGIRRREITVWHLAASFPSTFGDVL